MQSDEELLKEVDAYKRELCIITQSCPVDMRIADWINLQSLKSKIWDQINERLNLIEQRDQAKSGSYKR